jgi:ubiquinone/menaquinone biosynthesis C-methylase UbiE
MISMPRKSDTRRKKEVKMQAVTQHNEAITGIEEARKYAAAHRKYAGPMYGGLVKSIRRLGLPGHYLEMGAGPGFLAVMLAERLPAIEITTVDLSPGMVTIAGELIREKKLENRIHCLQGDSGDERFLEKLGAFNLVYTAFSLHHWKEPEKALRNLWRSVQPGGALCILDFRRIGWICSLPVGWRELEPMREAYTTKEVAAMFRRMGIRDYQSKIPFPYLFQIITVRK